MRSKGHLACGLIVATIARCNQRIGKQLSDFELVIALSRVEIRGLPQLSERVEELIPSASWLGAHFAQVTHAQGWMLGEHRPAPISDPASTGSRLCDETRIAEVNQRPPPHVLVPGLMTPARKRLLKVLRRELKMLRDGIANVIRRVIA